jgi:hypothetical protein
MDADDIALPTPTRGQVADALQKCVACHSTYQVRSPEGESLGRCVALCRVPAAKHFPCFRTARHGPRGDLPSEGWSRPHLCAFRRW